MIRVNNVHKSYNKDTEIVKGVTFSVGPGVVYGLLGPNGAGKTTLMQMISTLTSPTSGTISICGITPANEKDILDIHRKIGFLTTEVKLDPLSSPDQLFDFFAKLYDISDEDAQNRKQMFWDRFGIEPFADKRIVELSTGMKQKISIAISLIHNPPVIIFDEPTNGLDILTSKQVTDYLMELKDNGCAIILSTHIFSVAESLCDTIGILIDGHLITEGSAEKLTQDMNAKNFEEAFFKLYTENHKDETNK